MFGSAWRHLAPAIAGTVVVGLAVLLVYALCAEKVRLVENQLREQYYSDKAVAEAYADIENSCLDLHGDSLVDCIVKRIKPARDEEREERDLSAQENMSRWALLLLLVSFLGLFVSGIGIWLIFATLKATRKIAGMENRPWVGIDAAINGDIEYRGSDVWECSVSMKARNFGNCPATFFKITFRDFDPFNSIKLPEEIAAIKRRNEKTVKTNSFGTTIFPHDETETDADVKFNVSGYFKHRPDSRPFASRLLILVATYLSAHDGSVHHTWCVMNVSGFNGGLIRFDTQRDCVPVEEIDVFRLPMHHGAT